MLDLSKMEGGGGGGEEWVEGRSMWSCVNSAPTSSFQLLLAKEWPFKLEWEREL